MSAKYQAYEEYKDSGVEWIEELPVNWVATALKRYCNVTDGSHHSPKIQSNGKPFISVTDVGVNDINFEDSKKILIEDYQRLVQEGCKPNTGDVLLTKDGTIGRATIVREDFPDFVILSSLGLLSPLKKLLNRYLYYYLISGINIDQMNSLIHGSALRRMTISKIDELLIFIPSLPEQEKIANFLDHETAKIDTLIEKQQQLIKLLKEKRQAVISHAVTKGLNPNAPMRDSGVEWLGEVPEHWGVWKFSHIAPIITCGIASTPTYVDEDNGMPFFSAQNVRDNKLTLHKYNYISYELHELLTRNRKPEKGDLLVTRVGAGIGEACVIDIDMEFSIYVSLTHIRVIPDIALNKFIMYFFGSDYCKYLNHQGTVTGGGVGNLNVNNVVKYKIPLPNLGEQNEIVKFLDDEGVKFDNVIAKADSAIKLMQERRTALISAAVTGKIDLRNWQVANKENKEAAL